MTYSWPPSDFIGASWASACITYTICILMDGRRCCCSEVEEDLLWTRWTHLVSQGPINADLPLTSGATPFVVALPLESGLKGGGVSDIGDGTNRVSE